MIAPIINSESLLALRFLLFAGGRRPSPAKGEEREAILNCNFHEYDLIVEHGVSGRCDGGHPLPWCKAQQFGRSFEAAVAVCYSGNQRWRGRSRL